MMDEKKGVMDDGCNMKDYGICWMEDGLVNTANVLCHTDDG